MDRVEFFFKEAKSGLIPRVDAKDLFGGDVAVVQSFVALIHKARADCEDLISSDPTTVGVEGQQRSACQRLEDAMLAEEGTGSYGVATEVVADSKDMAHEDVSDALIREDGDAEGVVSNLKGSFWSRRIRTGKVSDERESNPSRVHVLQASMRAYVDMKAGSVVNPGDKF